jgi:large subunit ribosomal protein L28
MSRVCTICGKGPMVGNTVSHSVQRSSRRFLPNLHTVQVEMNGKVQRIRVCGKCLKKLKATA